MEDTKQRILEKSLELFSTKGYDAVSVGEIAKAVGIKAPSLYNHFPGKQAIFDAILETTSAHYQKDTAEISVHVQDSQKDIPVFSHISEELLVEKVRQIFLYSLHDKTISQFRRMMTLEQFRSPKFAELLSKRYVDWMISYHAGILLTLVSMLTLLIYTSGEELSNRAWWIRTLLHAILLEAVLLPLAHNWGFWYNTLDGLIYGTFILAAKVMWHLIDFGQSFYMAAALNEQIRKRKREEIQKEGSNNG